MNSEMALSYQALRDQLTKGIRNRNWIKLSHKEKALYRAALAYSKPKKKLEMGRDIVNRVVVDKLVELIEKLSETRGMKVFKRGFKKAVELYQKSEENSVFIWVTQFKHWLKDPDYIFWLGTVR